MATNWDRTINWCVYLTTCFAVYWVGKIGCFCILVSFFQEQRVKIRCGKKKEEKMKAATSVSYQSVLINKRVDYARQTHMRARTNARTKIPWFFLPHFVFLTASGRWAEVNAWRWIHVTLDPSTSLVLYTEQTLKVWGNEQLSGAKFLSL